MNKDEIVRNRIRFSGWVQGVGFRYRATHAARSVGATGWVRNEDDGTVLMEIQGTEKMITDALILIQRGRWIRIEDMKIEKLAPDPGEKGFHSM